MSVLPESTSVQPRVKGPVRIGLLGLGTVGTGVYKLLSENSDIRIEKIAVRDSNKARALSDIPTDRITTDVDAVLSDPSIDVVVELMGGLDYPCQVIKKALQAGKHVVTANKVVIAHHGPELFKLAADNRVNLLFEGAVAGGIPIVLPLKVSLSANRIQKIAGILNGTTNYILTRMEEAGLPFADALLEAQQKGFAEADPTADVEGHDAACKIGILSSIATRYHVDHTNIFTEGITNIGAEDIRLAKTLGYAIKLIALAQETPEGAVDIRVHPMLVPMSHPLAKITYENNAIWLHGHAVGEVMFYGKGAGELPTASAVSGDIKLIVNNLLQGLAVLPGLDFQPQANATLLPVEQTTNAYYIRLQTRDEPGVIGQLGQACGNHRVSLNAVLQQGTDPATHSATIVLLTHDVQEADMQAALNEIRSQSTTVQIHTVLRVFQP